jgi:ATP synthase protein I
MAKRDNTVMIGKYAFIIGLILAIVAGVVSAIAGYAYLPLIIVVLGLLVGFLNISEKNVTTLLLGIIALSIVGTTTVSVVPTIGSNLQTILNNFVVFVGAAGFVVAIKAILQVSKV